MHPCLSVQELLSIIFAHLKLGSKNTLVALARTCKTFQEPALNELYAEVEGFDCFLQCLPRTLWVINLGKLNFTRPMDPRDWCTLQNYARRVQTLCYDSRHYYAPCIEEEVFRSLCFCPTSALFPKIQKVVWEHAPDYSTHFIRFIIGPIVNYVSTTFNPLLMHSYASLGIMCPNITSFHLHARRFSKDIPSLPSNLLHMWKRLENVSIAQPSLSNLQHLASLKSLKTLSISWNFPPKKMTKQDFGENTFSQLRHLSIHSYKSLAICSNLLESMSETAISPNTLELRAEEVVDDYSFSRLISLLTEKCSHQDMHSITIRANTKKDGSHIVNLPAFRPLLSFKNLTHFSVRCPDTFDLNDQGLKEIATAWPHLEVLDMASSWVWDRRPRITLPGLIPLLAHCPHLHTLSLGIDATRPITTFVRPGNGVCNTLICSLRLGGSPIRHPLDVAAFLSNIMPCVREIINDPQGGVDKYYKRWCAVAKAVPAFASVRKEERTRSDLKLEYDSGGDGDGDGEDDDERDSTPTSDSSFDSSSSSLLDYL
ncbi:hypothetical protein BJ138DRAFT_1077244 [Hygrophoropsis aurantiaca]|uniref:Uncharacterized protein n=1 Tax=Hygrophoropsis aurantiaca TaxID=72124 RepID=A0ACB8AQD0_9AGAM|nr:hypothetical protein BJ138DRAFT_1077244 [Hygrophoropsis aurantiaca]